MRVEIFPSRPDGDDDPDDLAALDFSAADDDDASGLDAFDAYLPPDAAVDSDLAWGSGDSPTQDEGNDELDSPLFTVMNPAGTVSVSALMDGRVQEIDLAAEVTRMTETELGDEIIVIAGLARQQARSAQYAFVSEVMHEMGQNPAETRDFVGRTMGLPSPEEARYEEARVFTNRYASDHE